MSCHTSRWPVQPNHIPTASMIGGAAVTTALASRSTSGIETGRTVSGAGLEAGASSGGAETSSGGAPSTTGMDSGRAVSAAGAGDSDVI